MASPTAQAIALAVLRDQGILSLAPSGPQANLCRPTDIDAVALSITAAFQEMAQESAAEQLGHPGSGYINAPTIVTFTATQGSTTISAFATWASWMEGCTLRSGADSQDNELLSATTLSRPWAGASASGISGTVYNDCFTLGADVERIVGPLMLLQNRPVVEIVNRTEFAMRMGFVGFNYGNNYGNSLDTPNFAYPFWAYCNKPTDFNPSWFFLDTYYDPTLAYVKRRIRLSPMPTTAQAIGWTNKMTPIRIVAADIVSPLTTLVAAGANISAANQTYAYVVDVNGYRLFGGQSTAQWSSYFHPILANYILTSAVNLQATPTAYWISPNANSPLGIYTAGGTATGTVTLTTTDSGGGAADPGTIVPIPDGWQESILLPIARQNAAGLPTFKNDGIRAELIRQYQRAIGRLRGTVVSSKQARTGYL